MAAALSPAQQTSLPPAAVTTPRTLSLAQYAVHPPQWPGAPGFDRFLRSLQTAHARHCQELSCFEYNICFIKRIVSGRVDGRGPVGQDAQQPYNVMAVGSAICARWLRRCWLRRPRTCRRGVCRSCNRAGKTRRPAGGTGIVASGRHRPF